MSDSLCDKDLNVVADILMQSLDITAEQISREARLGHDLGADSLAMVEISMALEDRFGISIPDEKLEQVETVGDTYDLLAEFLHRNRGGN